MEKWNDAFRERAGREGLEFEARFYGAVVQRAPSNTEALAELGHALTRLKRFREGLEVDRRLVQLVPENETAHYNLACSLALCERPAEAISALETAVVLGYDDASHLMADEDLESLHSEPRFKQLVSRLQR